MAARGMATVDGTDLGRLRAALAGQVDGEVRFDAGSRAAYAHDGSNYRQVPIGVVVPRTVDAAVAAVAVCRRAGVPVLSRGGGTSLAGQCCNEAVVIDWTKYCHELVSVDPDTRTAVLQPGIALDKANDALAKYRLMVGPKPSTHVSCTIGGMIGNNSCGASAQAYGKMVDAVRRLEVVTYGGLRMWAGETSDAEYEQIIAAGGQKAELYRRLRGMRDSYLGQIRTTSTGRAAIPGRTSPTARTRRSRSGCRMSVRPAWAQPPTRRASTRPTRAGRTPRCRPSGSATTCGTSAT
jgi:FAD/FMN-containing dehydrogenase